MKDTIVAIILSLVASFLYDLIKKALQQKPESTTSDSKFSKNYFRKVKKEFYISFTIGIVLSLLPITGHSFIDIGIQVLSLFMFFISLMAFMCLVELIDYFTNNDSADNS